MTNAITTTAQAPTGDTLAKFFQHAIAPQLAVALPKHLTADRMARVCLTALRVVPNLARCSQASFAGEIMKLGQLGLEPNTPLGHAYLIPRNGKNGWEVTTIIGYQGYLELARRSGLVRSIYAHVVREGDEFEYELGLHKKLEHRPRSGPEAKVTHVYSVAHLDDSEPLFEVLTFAEVEKRRKIGASGSGKSTPWDAHWEAMAKKSAIRALWAWLPKSAEMADAVEADEDTHAERRARQVVADEGTTDGAVAFLEALSASSNSDAVEVAS
jgi:recombination protein RecT